MLTLPLVLGAACLQPANSHSTPHQQTLQTAGYVEDLIDWIDDILDGDDEPKDDEEPGATTSP